MPVRRLLSFVVVVLVLALVASRSWADSVPIGEVVFDVNTPPGLVPGINSFTLFNLTAGLAAPGPGVQDPLLLSGQLALTLLLPTGMTTNKTVSFSGIGPGSIDIFDLASVDQVLSAVLTGTLTPTSATLNGGSSPVVLLPDFTVADPFNGGIRLATCTKGGPCAGEIDATVPEPNTLILLSAGLAVVGLVFLVRKRRIA
jgi:hypothetical protein